MADEGGAGAQQTQDIERNETAAKASTKAPADPSRGSELQAACDADKRRNFKFMAEAARRKNPEGDLVSNETSFGWITDDNVFWRHPIARIVCPFVVVVQDVYIYMEDPLNESHLIANYPGMGEAMGLMTFWWAETVPLGFLRLFLTVLALVGAGVIGKLVLVRCCKITHIIPQGVKKDQGSEKMLETMLCCILAWGFLYAGSMVYNVLIPTDGSAAKLSGASMELFLTLGSPTLQYRHVAMYFEILSLTLDYLSITMTVDVILQDRTHHPRWAPTLKMLWMKTAGGWLRVLSSYIFLAGGIVASVILIFAEGLGDPSWWVFGGTGEILRSFIAVSCVFTDLLMVVQDWDFPAFRTSDTCLNPVMIAGTFSTEFKCGCLAALIKKLAFVQELIPSCSRCTRCLPSADWFTFSISGKMLTYSFLLGIMAVDLLCTKTQMFYDPVLYGQYTDPNGQVWSIIDEVYLATAYDSTGSYAVDQDATAALISYEARWNVTTGAPLSLSATTDVKLPSYWHGDPGVKYIAFILGISMIGGFTWMVINADWKRVEELENIEKQAQTIVFDDSETLREWKEKVRLQVQDFCNKGLQIRKAFASDSAGNYQTLEWWYDDDNTFGSFEELHDEESFVPPVKMTFWYDKFEARGSTRSSLSSRRSRGSPPAALPSSEPTPLVTGSPMTKAVSAETPTSTAKKTDSDNKSEAPRSLPPVQMCKMAAGKSWLNLGKYATYGKPFSSRDRDTE